MKSKGIDSTDIQLLNLLQCDARLTHKEMSYEINKSLSAVQVRIRHLQQNGYIKKFVTLLDRNKINMDLAVFIMISLKNYDQNALLEFQDQVKTFDEVMECYGVSGTRDFMLKVVVTDMTAYNSFILDRLSKSPNIGNVESLFVTSEAKHETAYKL